MVAVGGAARICRSRTNDDENTGRRPRPKERQLSALALHCGQHGHLRPRAGHHRTRRTRRPVHPSELGHVFRRHCRRSVFHRQRISGDRQLHAQPAAGRFRLGPRHPHRAWLPGLPAAVRIRSRCRIHRTAVARLSPAPGHVRLCRAQPQVRHDDAMAAARCLCGQPQKRRDQRIDLDTACRSAHVRAGRGTRGHRRVVLARTVQRRGGRPARAGCAVSGADADVESARVPAPRRIVRRGRVLLRQSRLDTAPRQPAAGARRHELAGA